MSRISSRASRGVRHRKARDRRRAPCTARAMHLRRWEAACYIHAAHRERRRRRQRRCRAAAPLLREEEVVLPTTGDSITLLCRHVCSTCKHSVASPARPLNPPAKAYESCQPKPATMLIAEAVSSSAAWAPSRSLQSASLNAMQRHRCLGRDGEQSPFLSRRRGRRWRRPRPRPCQTLRCERAACQHAMGAHAVSMSRSVRLVMLDVELCRSFKRLAERAGFAPRSFFGHSVTTECDSHINRP